MRVENVLFKPKGNGALLGVVCDHREEQVYRSLRATGVRFHYGYATFLCSSDFPVHRKLIAYRAEFTCKLSRYCASRNHGDCAIAPRNRPTQAASRWQSARSPIRPALSDAGIRRRKTHDRTLDTAVQASRLGKPSRDATDENLASTSATLSSLFSPEANGTPRFAGIGNANTRLREQGTP